MSKSLGTLTLDLVAKSSGFVAGMDKAERSSAKWRKQVEKDMKAAGKVMGVALAAGATAAAAGLVMVVNRQRELIDQSAKTAQQLDTTYTSMANLQRAGELGGVGFQKIDAAGRQLNINIGRAIQGTDAQVEAFERLGLSAQDVADVPLDKRIAMINKALRDNVQQSERAAVAAELFGARNGTAIQQLDPSTIAEAARQVEIFGLNLSDVDAAKVEMANDAMSTFGMLSDGAAKQLTVQLAPILKAIGDLFLEAADEAGGMGNAIERAVDRAVTGFAFVMDAGDGVKRAFTIVADIIVGTLVTAQYRALEAINAVTDALSRIPGIDIDNSGLKQSANEARMIAAEAAANIGRTLDEPLAGTKFKQFVVEAREAGQAAAEAAVAGKDAAKLTGEAIEESQKKGAKAVRETVDQVEKQITALERAAITWGMAADEVKIYDLRQQGATDTQLEYAKSLLDTVEGFEQAKKSQEDYLQLVKDLRTDEERLTDQLHERLAVLGAIADLNDAERNNAIGRIVDAGFADAPQFGGLAPEVGGPFGELLKIDKAEDELRSWYDTQLEMLETFRAERADLSATWDERELSLKQEHEDELARIEQARQMAQLAAAESIFGDLAGLARTFAGEQSGIYKAMFAVQKAASIAQSMVAIQTGIALAAANPWPANLAAMASVTAATASIVGNISSVALTGMAHDGIDSVPQTGTWLLEKGERVMTSETSKKLDQKLEGGSGVVVNIHNAPPGTNAKSSEGPNGEQMIDIWVADFMSDGRTASVVQNKFGLAAQGR